MKRVLISSILGLAATVATTYGQANFSYDTYNASNGAPQYQVQWSGSLAPVADSELFKADLVWSFGTVSGSIIGTPVKHTPDTTLGWIQGGFISLGTSASYATGTPLSMTLDIYQGASYAAALASTTLGHGQINWTEPGVGSGESPLTFTGMPDTAFFVTVSSVPEPTTIALAGLGMAALFVARRRS